MRDRAMVQSHGGRATDAEIELLLACSQPCVDVEDGRIERLLRLEIDWERLIRTALAHGVSPLLARRLGRLQSDGVPDEIREALELHLLDNRERNVELTRALFEILDSLEARNILALPFKGQVLGAVAYGDYCLRRGGDIDFLVKKRDLRTVWQTLEALGYRERNELLNGRPMSAVEHAGYLRYEHEYVFLRLRDRIVVEPHWAIVPTTLSIDLDCEEFWDRVQTVNLDGRETSTVAVPDLLLVLCVHASKHDWSRLQWICDVAAVLESHPGLDLGAVLDSARARGFERMVLLGLGLAQHMLGTALAPIAQARLQSDAEAVALVNTIADRLFIGLPGMPEIYKISRLQLRMRERYQDRVAFVFRTLTTPTLGILQFVALPTGLQGLYVPVKLMHVVALPIWRLVRPRRRRAAGRERRG